MADWWGRIVAECVCLSRRRPAERCCGILRKRSPYADRFAGESTNMFSVYVLHSERYNRNYIGHAQDLEVRLLQHNSGKVRATKYGIPWKIVYQEKQSTRSEAFHREQEIKRYKGGILFKKLIGTWRG